jgi:threonine/homoserine/homoserine lactone efflux protein
VNDLGVFLAATLALNLTPGPDMLYVITRSATEGRAPGVVSALGIATGCVVHTVAVAAGVAGLLAAVPVAYDGLRYLGAAYLVYLGVRRLVRPGPPATGEVTSPPQGLWPVYRQGVITNVLNPKVALFFLAFLPQFVDRSAGGVSLQLAALGTLFNVSGTIVNVLVALAASGTVRWTRGSAIPEWAARASGLVFVALGVRLAWRR